MNITKDKTADLPKGWAKTRIKNVSLPPQYGWTTSAVSVGKLKLLRTTDITSGCVNWDSVPFCKQEPERPEKYLLEDGDVVISRAGSVGYSYLVKQPRKAIFASYLIRFKPLIDTFFFSYFLKGPTYWRSISEKKLGIAVQNVNATKLKEIEIPVPPLPEQKRIVAKIEALFTKLDAGVEGLKKAKVELKRYRQAVLKAAFEGKLTADWRKKNKDKLEPASKLLERIAKEREKNTKGKKKKLPPLDTSKLPDLPEGWEWTRLDNISDALGGNAFKSKNYVNEGYQIIKIGNVKVYGLDISVKPCFIRPNDDNIINKYLLRPCDILITLTGTRRKRDYGFVGMIKDEENLLLNQRVARLRFHPMLKAPFFLIALQSDNFRNQFFENETGNVGQGNVGMGAIRQSFIVVPPVEEQEQIVQEVERHLSIADKMEQTIEKSLKQSGRLRQSILKKAFEGKLVPQDPEDEPAEKLLERIKVEKLKLHKKKGNKDARK